jgi:hypothetical protein
MTYCKRQELDPIIKIPQARSIQTIITKNQRIIRTVLVTLPFANINNH